MYKTLVIYSGFISSWVTNPIWLVKTRLQLDRSHSSLPMVVRRIRAESGIFGFWKGLTASWWGISETVIHFVIYEFLKKSLAEHQNKKKDENMTLLDFIGSMACGATSKTCATCVAYPHGECLYALLTYEFSDKHFEWSCEVLSFKSSSGPGPFPVHSNSFNSVSSGLAMSVKCSL